MPSRAEARYPRHAGFFIRKPLNGVREHHNFAKRAGRHLKRDQKFFPQDFTGCMGASCFTNFLAICYPDHSKSFLSSGSHEFDVFRPFSRPYKTIRNWSLTRIEC